MQRNIILVGFMGTGKSTIGRLLSRSLRYPLVDTDQHIESQQEESISDLFSTYGEGFFRELETTCLQDLMSKNHHVISTGGGIVTTAKNRPLLRELGYVVWLRTSPEEILLRTSKNKNRPLLNVPDPLPVITKLLDERIPLYQEAAHLSIETDHLRADEIVTGITESARYHFAQLDQDES